MNSQWESNPQVKGLYVIQTFQPRIERDSLILNAPSRGYGRRFRTWEIEHTLLLDPRFFVPMGWLALGVWPYCQTSLFPSCNCTFWTWKWIPSGIQTHTPSILKCLTSWEESNPRRLRNLTLPSRERVYLFRHGKLKRSFSKVIYHGLDNTGQLLPRCFLSQRHEHVSTCADIWVALNQSQSTYHGVHGRASYTTEHFALPLIQIEVDVSESHAPNGI